MNRRSVIKNILAAVAGVVAAPWRKFIAGGAVYDASPWFRNTDLFESDRDVVEDLRECTKRIEGTYMRPDIELISPQEWERRKKTTGDSGA